MTLNYAAAPPSGLAWAVYIALTLVLAAGAYVFVYRHFASLARRLRASETRLTEAQRINELLLTYTDEGICGVDREGRLTLVNRAATRMLGDTDEDLGRLLVAYPPHGDSGCNCAAGQGAIQAICREGIPQQSGDAVFRRKDGTPLEVQYMSVPLGEPTSGTLVIFNDNTAFKQRDALLARWQLIFANAGWGVGVCNGEAEEIELMNPAFARMHGYRLDELVGARLREFVAEECRSDLPHYTRLTDQTGHQIWESWHLRKDGSRFPVQIDATAIKDEAGRILYRVINLQDITTRRHAEDVLRESEALLACAQAQGKLGSWQLQIGSGRLDFSAECCRIFALPFGAPIGYDTFLASIHPDDRAYVDRAWQLALAGEPYDIQHRIVAAGEIKWVRQRAELEFAPDWTPLRGIGTTQDITELKLHENELLRSRQNLRELAAHHEKIREEERAHIAREIHDELGQYLTALRMDTALLKMRHGAGNAELERHTSGMIKTIDTTIGVVRNLASSLRPAALDMGLVSAAEWLLAEFEQRAQIRCRLHAPQEAIELDEARCIAAFRILQESLTNIARYANADEVNVRVELIGDALEMEISDDGVGFDTREVQGRKTFGLMGMRERVLRFGGQFRIDTEPGAGTTARIRIPCPAGGAP